jgi:hypothetical protein
LIFQHAVNKIVVNRLVDFPVQEREKSVRFLCRFGEDT